MSLLPVAIGTICIFVWAVYRLSSSHTPAICIIIYHFPQLSYKQIYANALTSYLVGIVWMTKFDLEPMNSQSITYLCIPLNPQVKKIFLY